MNPLINTTSDDSLAFHRYTNPVSFILRNGRARWRRNTGERIATTLDGELWSSPLFFILLVGSLEWLLRKKWQLK